MTPLLRNITNMRNLRAGLRGATKAQLDDAQEKLKIVCDEIKEKLNLEEKEHRKQEEKLALLKEQIIASGVDFDKLSTPMGYKQPSKVKSKSKKQNNKNTLSEDKQITYQFDENGETKHWDGQGDMPLAISESINEGLPLSDFIVNA